MMMTSPWNQTGGGMTAGQGWQQPAQPRATQPQQPASWQQSQQMMPPPQMGANAQRGGGSLSQAAPQWAWGNSPQQVQNFFARNRANEIQSRMNYFSERGGAFGGRAMAPAASNLAFYRGIYGGGG